MAIFVFGDSIAYGAWDSQGGWVARLTQKLNQQSVSSNFNLGQFCYNLSIPGENTSSLLLRFTSELKARIELSELNTIIFAIGVNDSLLLNKIPTVPDQTFQENLTSLFTQAQRFATQVYALGLFPIDESKVNPIPWLPDQSYTLSSVNHYDEQIKFISQKTNIKFIDILAQAKLLSFAEYLADGIHPNDEGHNWIYQQVASALV